MLSLPGCIYLHVQGTLDIPSYVLLISNPRAADSSHVVATHDMGDVMGMTWEMWCPLHGLCDARDMSDVVPTT